jgi:Tol biopolymer transport system component
MTPIEHRSPWRTGAARCALAGVVVTMLCAFAPAAASAAVVTDLVSKSNGGIAGNGPSVNARISADGSRIAFESAATQLISTYNHNMTDIFVRKVGTGTTALVSHAAGSTQPANGGSIAPAISADGRFVVFVSSATNLVPDVTATMTPGVYRRDLDTDAIVRIDVATGGVPANRPARAYASIDATGSRVAFVSMATNLDGRDPSVRPDVFVRDVDAGTTNLVSVAWDGVSGDQKSESPSISGDGTRVAFASDAMNLLATGADVNGVRDVFVRDLSTGTTTLLSRGVSGLQGNAASDWPAISGNGLLVAYVSQATNLVAQVATSQQVYLSAVGTSHTECVSVGSTGRPGNAAASNPGITADGRFVAFESEATDLLSGPGGVFLRDRTANSTVRVAAGVMGGAALLPNLSAAMGIFTSLSADGRFVAFESSVQSLVQNVANGQRQVYRSDTRSKGPAYLSAPTLKTNYIGRNVYFYLSGRISRHSARSSVRVYFYYKADGAPSYRKLKYVTVALPARATSYRVKVRLPSRGNYCVRARHLADAQHTDTWSRSSIYFRIH